MIHYKINRILFLTIYVGGQSDLDGALLSASEVRAGHD